MRTIWIGFLPFVVFITRQCDSANILIFHVIPVKSHLMFLAPLAQALAEKNHNVTVYSSDPNFGSSKNMRVIVFSIDQFSWKKGSLRHKTDILTMQNTAHFYTSNVFDKFMSSEPVQKLIQSNDTYDAVITNTMFFYQCLSVFQHRFNALGIEFMPHRDNPSSVQWIGSDINPAYVHSVGSTADDRPNFFQRLTNTFETLFLIAYTNIFVLPCHEAILDKRILYPGHETRPPLSELLSNRSLVLVNGHPLLGTMAPLAPIQKDLGGLTIRPKLPLHGKFKEFVDGAKDGIIVMSWGTLIQANDEEDRLLDDTIMEVLGKLKQRTLWKNPRKVFSKPIPENVLVDNWLPQPDLLGDERVKLFITHGGFNSMAEAIHYGVPVLVTPFTLDQPRTAMKVVKYGTGIVLEISNLTAESFIWAINEIIDNKKYKASARRLSVLFNDRILSPKDEAVFWVEYVLKHGNILQSPKTFMSNFVLWNLDTIAFVIIVKLLLIVTLKKLWKGLMRIGNVKRKCA